MEMIHCNITRSLSEREREREKLFGSVRMRIGCFSHVTCAIFLSSLHPSKYSCLRQNLQSSCIILAWFLDSHTVHVDAFTHASCSLFQHVHVCISGSSSMVMSVLSHTHVRVCGKGKNIFQETEYHPHAISGEITFCAFHLCLYTSQFAILHFHIL